MELVAIAIMIAAAFFGRWSIQIKKSGWSYAALTIIWAIDALLFFFDGKSEAARLNFWVLHVILPAVVLGGLWIGWILGWMELRRKSVTPGAAGRAR